MNIEFMKNRIVTISIKDYIKECKEAYEEAGGKISSRGNTPATDTLFVIDDTSKQLNENRSEVFHHIVSKLLYVSTRAQIDIDLAISFLCTRVSKSTEQDFGQITTSIGVPTTYEGFRKNHRCRKSRCFIHMDRRIMCNTRQYEKSHRRSNIHGYRLHTSQKYQAETKH